MSQNQEDSAHIIINNVSYITKRDILTKSALRYTKQFELRLLVTEMKSNICKSLMRKGPGGGSYRPVSLRVDRNFMELRKRESKFKDLEIGLVGWQYILFDRVCIIYVFHKSKKYSSPTLTYTNKKYVQSNYNLIKKTPNTRIFNCNYT